MYTPAGQAAAVVRWCWPAIFFHGLAQGELHDVLFMATGAMMSPDSIKQGQAIPAVAHLLHLRSPEQKGGR